MFRNYTIDVLIIDVKFIITQLISYIKGNQKKSREPYGQSENIDKGEEPLLSESSKYEFKVVSKHSFEIYSFLRVSTGLSLPALRDWKRIVPATIVMIIPAVNIKIQASKLILSA